MGWERGSWDGEGVAVVGVGGGKRGEEWDGAGWDGMARGGMADGMALGWDEVGRGGIGWDGVG